MALTSKLIFVFVTNPGIIYFYLFNPKKLFALRQPARLLRKGCAAGYHRRSQGQGTPAQELLVPPYPEGSVILEHSWRSLG